MADKKISQLTNLTGANLAENDEFVLVDTSADETKAITFGELKTAFDTGTGFVRVTGDTMTGDLGFGDNDKAIFGAGSDLEIYHDGSNSWIKDVGTGSLILKADGPFISLQNSTGNDQVLVSGTDVKLSHSGSTKLATTSTGIDVTGTVTADGLTVDGKAEVNGVGSTTGIQLDNGAQAHKWYLVDNFTNRWDINTSSLGAIYNFGSNNGARNHLQITTGGDISFYEDTGTTAKFFWDASAESLGIGTSSPSYTADIQSGSTATPALRAKALSGTAAGTAIFDAVGGSGDVRFRVQNDGNVGIGTSSPSAPLHVAGDARIGAGTGDASLMGMVASGDNFKITTSSGIGTVSFDRNVGIGTSSPAKQLHIKGGSGDNYSVRLDDTFGNTGLELGQYGSNGQISSPTAIELCIGQVEKARIDSSGNLLVGKTSQSDGATAGHELLSDGRFYHTKSGDHVGRLNRLSTDGDILRFAKDGSTVGIIGTNSNTTYIDGSAANTGLQFAGSTIAPRDSGALSDASVDLGAGSYRFKDLYLSGGVYLGGTGAANKLDSYEEGTWTPVLAGSASGQKTPGTINMGRYTKVGNLVTVSGTVSWDSTDTLSGLIRIEGLPFTVNSPVGSGQQYRAAGSLNGTVGVTMPTGYTSGFGMGSDGGTTWIYLVARSTTAYSHNPTIANVGSIYGITMTYETTE